MNAVFVPSEENAGTVLVGRPHDQRVSARATVVRWNGVDVLFEHVVWKLDEIVVGDRVPVRSERGLSVGA